MSQTCTPEQLWKQYQKLNTKFMNTTEYIEQLQKELEKLSENKWNQICRKSLQSIRNEIVLLQMKDKKLTSQNKELSNGINNYKQDVRELEKQRAQLESNKK